MAPSSPSRCRLTFLSSDVWQFPVASRDREGSACLLLLFFLVFLYLLNIFSELNESPSGSICPATFAASASVMEREGNRR